jgi:hypothetical protein
MITSFVIQMYLLHQLPDVKVLKDHQDREGSGNVSDLAVVVETCHHRPLPLQRLETDAARSGAMEAILQPSNHASLQNKGELPSPSMK